MEFNNKQSKTTMTKPMTRLGWISLMLTFASQASGFQSARELHVSIPANSLRTANTAGYGIDILAEPSVRSSMVSTRLQYRASADESSTTTSPLKWFNTIFPRSEENEDREQQSVDEYLEFLDRRYRRLHSAEKVEEVKPFSALNWLHQGSESRNEAIVTQQQQEDALFVLGVAGLASEKLLQKHQLPVDDEHSALSNAKHIHPDIMEAVDADIVQEGPAAVLIKKVIVPLIRVFYVAQRRKELFVAAQLQKLKTFSGSALRKLIKAVLYGPANATNTLLEVGGGKKSLALTAAFAGTIIILLRPVLQAALTEGAVRP